MAWKATTIITDSGEKVLAQSPYIISASRETDIPAFYMDWFVERIKKGYSAWVNPFNNKKSYVDYSNCKFIVFWSKNPKPLIQYIPYLRERGIDFYIQFTLNDYEKEGLEFGIPSLDERIETFKELSRMLGPDRVIWRFDPLILTDTLTIDVLISRIRNIMERLDGYTRKLVFSFVDIKPYRKVASNLSMSGIKYQEWTSELMAEFADKLLRLRIGEFHYLEFATCGEAASFNGIKKNKCVDDDLIIKLAWNNKTLMDFLGVEIKTKYPSLFGNDMEDGAISLDQYHYHIKKKDNKDKGQRQFCGCIMSKDIGQYNTCCHLCKYCYANNTPELAMANHKAYLQNKYGETILPV